MGDTSFTPGPYALHPVNAWIVCPQLDDDGEPCPVAALAWPTKYRSEEETRANGHLFAATPDLYEALNELRHFLGNTTAPPLLHKLCADADAALAKARGEA